MYGFLFLQVCAIFIAAQDCPEIVNTIFFFRHFNSFYSENTKELELTFTGADRFATCVLFILGLFVFLAFLSDIGGGGGGANVDVCGPWTSFKVLK